MREGGGSDAVSEPIHHVAVRVDGPPCWTWRCEFSVEGLPKPQPRARSFAVRGKGGQLVTNAKGEPIIRQQDPGSAEGWKAAIADAADAHRPLHPLTGPVFVRVRFVCPRPKSLRRAKDPAGELWHVAAKDVDNFAKALLDVLTVMRFWLDDGQVAKLVALKTIEAKDGAPGAYVVVEEMA